MNRDDIIRQLEQEWRDRLAAAVAAEREAIVRIIKDDEHAGEFQTFLSYRRSLVLKIRRRGRNEKR